MSNYHTPLLAAFLAAGLAGCGGRTARIIPEVTSLDGQLSCEHLAGEYQGHQVRIQELQREGGRVATANVVGVLLGGVGGLMAMDLTDSQRLEAEALQRRNNRILALAGAQRCAGAPPVAAMSLPMGPAPAPIQGLVLPPVNLPPYPMGR